MLLHCWAYTMSSDWATAQFQSRPTLYPFFTDSLVLLSWLCVSSHQHVWIQPCWDIWSPQSSFGLSSALVSWYISVTLMTPGSLSPHQKGDLLSFCVKTWLRQLSAGPTWEGFSHVHPIIRVLNRSWFLSNKMGKIITYSWLDIIQKPALPLTGVFLVMQICAVEHLDILQNDPAFSCWVCTDCLSWHCKQCSLSTVSHSGGRVHSGSATVRCLCCWQRSFISACVSIDFNLCGLVLYSLIPMTSSSPFFSAALL